MDEREGLQCDNCNANSRSRHLAKVIVEVINSKLGLSKASLAVMCISPEISDLAVAEINAAGDLHQFLKNAPGLHYSEYGSQNPLIPSQDLLNLTYEDASFDLAVNSDVLEHVPDPDRALTELRRILRPDGHLIFTVPIVWAQKRSRTRARMIGGKVVHALPPSFHGSPTDGRSDYLVFSEFGRDFVSSCEKAGFTVQLWRDKRNPALITIVGKPIAIPKAAVIAQIN